MQKLLRRTAQAEKQAARRKAKRNDTLKRAAQNQEFRKRMGGVRDANLALNAARARRREDWEMGPLAPQRDTPIRSKDGSYWGSLSLGRSLGELSDKQLELACKWAGGKKYLCVKPGDKVAIMQGPDKGKIGTVKSIEEQDGSATLEGDHLQQNVTVSEYIAQAGMTPEDTFVQLTALRVPIWAMRLVHPLRDPATGKIRDVVINQLAPTRIIRDKATGRETWSRVVPGLKIEIPWPRAFEEAERNEMEAPKPDNECDTLRIDAEENTFIPTLLRPPMPSCVIDELRNRYSKFRTRHEPEYIAKKETEEREKLARSKAALSMRTPLQELNALIREEKRKRPEPVLTNDMLVKIGEVMARNQHRAAAVKRISQGLVTTAVQRAEERRAKERLLAQAKTAEYRVGELKAEVKKAGPEEAGADKLRVKVKALSAKAKELKVKATASETKAKPKVQVPVAPRVPPPATVMAVSEPAPQDAAPPPS